MKRFKPRAPRNLFSPLFFADGRRLGLQASVCAGFCAPQVRPGRSDRTFAAAASGRQQARLPAPDASRATRGGHGQYGHSKGHKSSTQFVQKSRQGWCLSLKPRSRTCVWHYASLRRARGGPALPHLADRARRLPRRVAPQRPGCRHWIGTLRGQPSTMALNIGPR